MTELSIKPVIGIGDVQPGDDLAKLITTAAPWIADGDVLVVTSKIVSKSEGNLVEVPREGDERAAAKTEILAAETARVVAARPGVRIVATHHGFVMAAAGIDASNVDASHLVLLPKDPDASARALRSDLRERYGLDVVIIISDTMGRPWRTGLTDVALGVAGMDPIRDYRGEHDPYGNELSITQMSPADELCGAAELVKGKYDQVPVAVIRGLGITGTPDGPGAAVLIRPIEEDMFSMGVDEAIAEGLRRAATLDGVDAAPSVTFQPVDAGLAAFVEPDSDLVRAGIEIHARRCRLEADGIRTGWVDGALDSAPEGITALGVITFETAAQ
jgi:coenzyme F420-0:L-glutamate ligase / coenzyme F420-1:gamma-L-glutamate ligase